MSTASTSFHKGDGGSVSSLDDQDNIVGGIDPDREASTVVGFEDGIPVNASGHKDQLKRQYGLLGTYELALTIDNAWIALGGSIAISISNGGPPGVLYELIVACLFYAFIGASIAEMASSIPSAGGVYHWASITPGIKYGKVTGFFAGFLNFLGWLFDLASITQIVSNAAVQCYVAFHPGFQVEPWHVYTTYIIITWVCTTIVIFANRAIPYIQHLGSILVLGGGLLTIVLVTAMPNTHASNSFVWTDWNNTTGWGSGIAFLTGVLNGAFTVGTPDAITHLAEELPNPKKDLPKAVAVQIGVGFLTAFAYAIAILYAITDLSAVENTLINGGFPIATVYSQATSNKGATFCLLLIIFLSLLVCVLGTYLTVSRTWWSLARDNATPFSSLFSNVNERRSCPVQATLFVALLCTALGAIPLSGTFAFNDLAGSFIILTTTSYAMAIVPNLLTRRKNMPHGPFWMGSAGFFINGVTVLLIAIFNVIFCFPFALPVQVQTMNYNSVILVGSLFLISVWWLMYGSRHYLGSKLTHMYLNKDSPDGAMVCYAMQQL